MNIEVTFQYELNRGYIYDEDGETIGENNFVISADYLDRIFLELFPCEDFDEFIDWYEADSEGDAIYQRALEDNEIIDEFETYYDKEEY